MPLLTFQITASGFRQFQSQTISVTADSHLNAVSC